MENLVDLHFHSSYSEGQHTPEELLNMARENGLSVIALTDHNVIVGNEEMLALADSFDIKAITGVELYVQFKEYQLHLLGFNFDVKSAPLIKKIKELQEDNKNNVDRSISALENQGFTIDRAALFSLPAHNYGAVHLLQALEQSPENVKKITHEIPDKQNDFFGKIQHYFGERSTAYFPLSTIPATEAIALIQQAGGFTSLAHPGQQLSFEQDQVIVALAKAGLDAIEVLSPYHNWHEVEHYQWLALQNKLLLTGGSDFHGTIDFTKNEIITKQWDYLHVPHTIFEQLKNKIPNL